MTPITVRRERIVPLPVDVVWQLIEPAESAPSWLPFAEACRRTSGRGLGRIQRMRVRWGRNVAEIDQEVIAYTPNALLRWKHVAETMNGKPAPQVSKEVVFSAQLESVG